MRIAAKKAHRWTQTVMVTGANGYDNLKASNVPKNIDNINGHTSTTFHVHDIFQLAEFHSHFRFGFAREIGNFSDNRIYDTNSMCLFAFSYFVRPYFEGFSFLIQ